MSYPSEYRQTAKDFDIWLRQSIWASNLHKDTRLHVLHDFTEDLTSWMKRLGYVMNEDWGLQAVCQWVYAIAVLKNASFQTRRNLRYPIPSHRNTDEDYEYFNFMMPVEEIELFQKMWISAEGFEPDTGMGSRLWLELPNFLYCYLDLETSKNGKYIRSQLDSSDSESDGPSRRVKSFKKSSDTYLQDMRAGFHGGDWSKV